MNESIFSKIFSYRERESISPLENYLTEIFAFCLESDLSFRKVFFSSLLDIELQESVFKISTQNEYEGYGRPDIEISFNDTAILFECKVEASERNNQLNDYASILTNHKQKYSNKKIVFLTKYFEHKELNTDTVKLYPIRWFEIYELINDSHSEITKQLKSFLKEQDMEKVKNFTIQDLLAMKIIPETLSKMDELLEQFKEEFKKGFGGYSDASSRSTRLQYECYINYVELNYQKVKYWLLIGFFWDYEEEIPFVGLSIEIPTKKSEESDLKTLFDKELKSKKEWEFEDGDANIYYSAKKPISEFITQEDDNIPAMKKFIEGHLKTLYELRQKYPKLLKK